MLRKILIRDSCNSPSLFSSVGYSLLYFGELGTCALSTATLEGVDVVFGEIYQTYKIG